MSNPKHTPGPWRADYEEPPHDPAVIYAGHGWKIEVAEIHPATSYEESSANARLIEEAPAMRQTLTDILNAVGDEFEITARHIAGVDSDGRIMLKGSFLELLVKGRALLTRIDGEDT